MATPTRFRVPQHTVLSLATFAGGGPCPYPSVLDCGNTRLVTSGRMAIALALRHLKIGPHDKVLVPAFHCNSMVEPVLWAGAQPVFYRIGNDTQADLADLRARIDPAVKALMITHFFGFPQAAARARALCDEAGIALIEDCAHAFFGSFAGRPPGWFADYAIASVMKFFPVYDGGCLVSSRRDLSGIATVDTSYAFQLKAAVNTLEHAFRHGRLPVLAALAYAPLKLKDAVWRVLRSSPARREPLAPAASSGGIEFDAAWLDKRMTTGSRLILSIASHRRIAAGRRRNFLLLQEGLRGLPGATPLFDSLPDGVVPYVFPLLVEDAYRAAGEMRAAGVPLMRWESFAGDVEPGTFPNSEAFYRRLLQIPCHDGLSPAEVAWMIDNIRTVLAAWG